jgi:hypothetical protein
MDLFRVRIVADYIVEYLVEVQDFKNKGGTTFSLQIHIAFPHQHR